MAPDPRRGLILQHGDDGGPDILGRWLDARGIEYDCHEAWQAPLPDDPTEFGWIASLGSEYTPGRDGAPAWVGEEVDFVRRAVDEDVPVLGLCFGGQVLAVATGGRVDPADPPEVGWQDVETAVPELIPPGPWLHFHYDQLEPPPGARVLARAPAGVAAFTLGRHLGLQFHPETGPEIATSWARQDAGKLRPLGLDPDRLREQGERVRERAEAAAARLFDSWWTKWVHYPEPPGEPVEAGGGVERRDE